MDPRHDIYSKEDPLQLFNRRRRNSNHANSSNGTPSPSGHQLTLPASVSASEFYSRRRRRRHRDERAISRAVWLALFTVCLVYGLILLLILAKSQLGRASTTKSEPPPPPTVATESTRTPVGDRITAWNRITDAILEAQTFVDRGNYPEAEHRIRRALEQTPQALRLRMFLARIYLDQKQYDKAHALLLEILEATPEDQMARLLMANCAVATTNWADALALAKWILDTAPNSPEAHEIAANAYIALNQKSLAIPHLKKLISLQRDNIVAQNRLGRVYLDLGDYAKAAQTFRDVLAQAPADATSYFNLAACYAKQGLANETAELLSQAAGQLGESFVATWLNDPMFENVRTTRVITALLETWQTSPSAK